MGRHGKVKGKNPIHLVQTTQNREKALLVGVILSGMARRREEHSLSELAALARTAGADVVGKLVQERRSADPATLIGKGKLHQVSREVHEVGADLVIFDVDLTPVQLKNLEKEIKKKIVDRSGLILDIFARRARTREAQIQVELAQLQYLLPRLTRRWTHLSRQEAGIGTRGPGETQLEVDRRAIRKRIDHLKDDLKKIERQRNVRRKGRRLFQKVALVGYTNVGKSSLLNSLADAGVFVEDRLFATLDATIRAMSLEGHRDVLLIDTVGFIRKLPPHLVASFRSTLEETVEADLLLHVVDISHPQYSEQIGSVQVVLRELGIDEKPTITVFNKVDLLEDRKGLSQLKQRFPKAVFTSAVKGIGLEALKEEIIRSLHEGETEATIRISAEETKKIAHIYSLATVVDRVFEDGVAVLRLRGAPSIIKRIQSEVTRSDDEDSHR
jgi:GTP-binding protein HflX